MTEKLRLLVETISMQESLRYNIFRSCQSPTVFNIIIRNSFAQNNVT